MHRKHFDKTTTKLTKLWSSPRKLKNKIRNNMLVYFTNLLETITFKTLPSSAIKERKLLNLPIYTEKKIHILPYFVLSQKKTKLLALCLTKI